MPSEPEPNKPESTPDDPEQSKRFIDMAKEVGADEDADALERAFKNIASKSPKEKKEDIAKTKP
jgi:hypothetical protein